MELACVILAVLRNLSVLRKRVSLADELVFAASPLCLALELLKKLLKPLSYAGYHIWSRLTETTLGKKKFGHTTKFDLLKCMVLSDVN